MAQMSYSSENIVLCEGVSSAQKAASSQCLLRENSCLFGSERYLLPREERTCLVVEQTAGFGGPPVTDTAGVVSSP